MIVDNDNISEPYERDIITIMLSPRLASHAPKVSITILIWGICVKFKHERNGINNTRHSIILSRQNNDINKWDICNIKENLDNIYNNIINNENDIELR